VNFRQLSKAFLFAAFPTVHAFASFSFVASALAAPGAPTVPLPTQRPPRPQPSPSAGGSAQGTTNLAGPTIVPGTPPSGAGGNQPTLTAKGADAKGETKIPPGKWRGKLDFSKVQLGELVKFIADLTQRNFIVPEKLKGNTITLICPTDLTVDEAYRAFLSALEANDITLVKVGKFYKLVASGDAAKSPIPTYTDDNVDIPPNDNIVTKVMRLEHSDATAISNILGNFKSKIAQVAVYAPTNALIISEWASNLVRLEKIITKLDTEGTNDQIHLMAVKYATASEVAQRLTELFDVKKGAGGGGGARSAGAPPATPGAPAAGGTGNDDMLSIQKLIPDDRTNQLIIVANEYSFRQLEDVIRRLDVPVGEDTGQIRVIPLQNANAEDLASTLSSLSTGQPKKKAGAPGTAAAQPVQGPQGGAQGAGSASLFEGDVKITADKATNALLVIASPSDYRSVKRMVDQLDIPRRQVFIEAAIMEVSISNEQNLGTQWYAPFPNPVPQSLFGANATQALPGVINGPSFGGQNLLTQAINPLSLLQTFGGALVGISGPGIPVQIPSITAGGVAQTINVPAFALVLRALQTSSNANVISTPYLLATDNEEAKIEVGTKEPFAKGLGAGASLGSAAGGLGALSGLLGGTTGTSALSGLGGALGGLGGLGFGGQSQIERIDVSLDITLTPHVNDSDRVMIEIDQKLEDITGKRTIGGVDFPVTSKRAVKSKVILEDQQTVVLGGLIKDNVTESVSGYPILSDIPIIGWLFKTKSTTRTKSNLLIVITPYIVRTKDDFRRIYERKLAEYKAYQDLVYADSKEYKPYVDFARKSGPVAKMAKHVKKEMTAIENGGRGDVGDVLVAPSGTDMTTGTKNEPSLQPTQNDTQSPQATDTKPGVILDAAPPKPQENPNPEDESRPEKIEVQ
jgi:general secretion pathway protein D